MIFRIAPAALAVLAIFNVASSLASPVTWAQHARRPPQNSLHNSLPLYRGPAPHRVPWEARAVLTHAKTPSAPLPHGLRAPARCQAPRLLSRVSIYLPAPLPSAPPPLHVSIYLIQPSPSAPPPPHSPPPSAPPSSPSIYLSIQPSSSVPPPRPAPARPPALSATQTSPFLMIFTVRGKTETGVAFPPQFLPLLLGGHGGRHGSIGSYGGNYGGSYGGWSYDGPPPPSPAPPPPPSPSPPSLTAHLSPFTLALTSHLAPSP